MPRFAYHAVTPQGESRRGHVQASDGAAAIRAVQDLDLWPVSVERQDLVPAFRSRLVRIFHLDPASRRSPTRLPESELAPALRELALLLQAGQPLDTALLLSAAEGGRRQVRQRLKATAYALQSGSSLAHAMAENAFPPLVVALVEAGENGGTLGETLGWAADLLERRQRLRQHLIASLSYPGLVLSVAVAAIAVLLGAVIPQIAPLLAGQEATLPALTRLILAASEAMTDGTAIWFLASTLAGAGVAGLALWRLSPCRRSRLLLALPVLGPALRQAALARFVRTLGMLLRCGVPLVPALTLASPVLGHPALLPAARHLLETARRGQPLGTAADPGGPAATAGTAALLLSPLAIQTLKVGEETGRLDSVLFPLADLLESRLESRLKRFLSLLEPLVLLGMSLMVGMLVLAVLSALLSVNEQIL